MTLASSYWLLIRMGAKKRRRTLVLVYFSLIEASDMISRLFPRRSEMNVLGGSYVLRLLLSILKGPTLWILQRSVL